MCCGGKVSKVDNTYKGMTMEERHALIYQKFPEDFGDLKVEPINAKDNSAKISGKP
mgnify:CR=1 FL=1